MLRHWPSKESSYTFRETQLYCVEAKIEPTKGATVYITGRKQETLEATANELGKNCRPIVCDHAEAEQIEKLFDQIRKILQFYFKFVFVV